MQKSFITATPDSGSGDGTVTCSASQNNTENSRSTTITVSGGGITRTVSISQKGTRQYLVNISPTIPYQSAFPAQENLEAFLARIYYMSPSGDLSNSIYASMINEIEADTVSDIMLNWSPFGKQNICDYTYQLRPVSFLNPDVQNGIGRLMLNIKKDEASGTYYYNLKQAAFHQGSPIVEVAFERNSTKPKIYTLSALHEKLYGDKVFMYFSAKMGAGNVIGIADDTTQICTDSQCRTSVGDTLKLSGRVRFTTSGFVLEEGGVSRVYATPTMLVQTNYIQGLKWFSGMNGESHLTLYLHSGAKANVYSPEVQPTYPIQQTKAQWSTSFNPIAGGMSLMNVDAFYNPD